jgi:hypothetical protein
MANVARKTVKTSGEQDDLRKKKRHENTFHKVDTIIWGRKTVPFKSKDSMPIVLKMLKV